jgi:hypothetical protein
MLEVIDGRTTFVTNFNGHPDNLPTEEIKEEGPYVLAFAALVKSGKITAPGKYGVYRFQNDKDKTVFTVYRMKKEVG